MTTAPSRDGSVEIDILKNRQRNLNPVYFGVKGLPFPVYELVDDVTKNGETVSKYEWRIYEESSQDNAFVIYSEKTPEEVFGILYRNLPSPSMLELFLEGVLLRHPESTIRREFIKGFPGAGKSYMAMLHSWLRDKRPPIVVDCGGRDLSELLYETVLDLESNKVLIDELEKRAKNGTLHPHSMMVLQNALTITDKEGQVTERNFLQTGNNKGIEILWDQLHKDFKSTEKLSKILGQIMHDEGISTSANALGMKKQPGVLYRAFIEDRVLVLDEYNKSDPDTHDCMQRVVQFFKGELDEVTIESDFKNGSEKGGISYTLRRADMGPNFFVNATGNAAEDGVTTHPLSESENSRWQPETVPSSAAIDWQHRYCQLLTNVPVSTLYQIRGKYWDENPNEFYSFLKMVRTSGLSPEEVQAIPEHELILLKHWRQVMDFTKNLSLYSDKVSKLFSNDSTESMEVNFAEVLDEINKEEEFKSEVAFDFRVAIKIITKALSSQPQSKPLNQLKGDLVQSFSEAPKLKKQEKMPLILNLGTRIINAFKKEMQRISARRGKNKTYQQLRLWGEQYGVFPPSRDTQEKKPLLEQHLNISPLSGGDAHDRAAIIQEQMCLYFKAKYPEMREMRDEKIVSLSTIKRFLSQGNDESKSNNDESALTSSVVTVQSQTRRRYRLVIDGNGEKKFVEIDKREQNKPAEEKEKTSLPANDDSQKQTVNFSTLLVVSDNKAELSDSPFVRADLVTEKNDNQLISHDSLMLSMIFPEIGERNIFNSWIEDISKIEGVCSNDLDKSLRMAETHQEAFSTTSLIVDVNGEEKPFHFIRNNKTKAMLVVGEGMDQHIQKLMPYARFDYIDRNAADAQNLLSSALYSFAPDDQAVIESDLKLAFLLRNRINESVSEDMKLPLARLMTSKKNETFNKVYVQKSRVADYRPKVG